MTEHMTRESLEGLALEAVRDVNTLWHENRQLKAEIAELTTRLELRARPLSDRLAEAAARGAALAGRGDE